MNADELLRRVAGPLSRLQWPVFYVGGATTHLYITDPLAPTPTATNDVDIVVAVYGRVEYQVELRNELIKIAREDTSEDSPHGRWILNGVKVDIMTPSANVLGFTNIWYEEAIRHPVEVNLSDGATIQCIAASYFVATKAEAFKARGNGDFLGSKDLEDIIAVVDGRPELVGEVQAAPVPLQTYLRSTLAAWIGNGDLEYAIKGYLPDAAGRDEIVLERLRILAEPRGRSVKRRGRAGRGEK